MRRKGLGGNYRRSGDLLMEDKERIQPDWKDYFIMGLLLLIMTLV